MKEHMDFIYDGKSSKDLGIIQARRNPGFLEEDFISNRNIIEEKIRGNDSPYLFEIERMPLEFDLDLFFSDDLSPIDKRKISRVFNQNGYKPLIFNDHPDQIFYCVPVQSSKIIHNGLNEGYLELKMRCNSPYSFSPKYFSRKYIFDSSTSNSDRIFEFSNKGDVECNPVFHIKKIGSGSVSIKSIFNGQESTINNLFDGEQILLDSERQEIESDTPMIYRYDDFNNRYISLPTGKTLISVSGNFELIIEYRYKFSQTIN